MKIGIVFFENLIIIVDGLILSGIVLRTKSVYPVSKERIFETKSNGSGGFDLSSTKR